MSLRFTILGSGSSAGVPRIGGDWGACDPANPRNRRRRCSVLVEAGDGGNRTRVLIDTSPDMREQLLAASVPALNAVLYTHEHADHTHGIDDLRAFYLMTRKTVPLWADEMTGQMLTARFPYCFYSAPGSGYPPIASLNRITPGVPVTIAGAGGDIAALPIRLNHGNIDALAFRFGNVAYSPDVNDIPEASQQALSGLDIWIVDALKRTPHPSHFCLADTLRWIERLKPHRAILTNMHIDMDYDTLRRELPAGIEPAYDGMVLTA